MLEACLAAARPRAVAALLRFFRDLDAAEDAFQEACLKAVRRWPAQGVPRDPVAWLVLVGRNAGVDQIRRRSRDQGLSAELTRLADGDSEARRIEQLDARALDDDLLRLLFICCHPALPAAQQIALALKVVAGLSVAEIASAFLVQPRAMEQRLTRARRRVAAAGVPYAAPSPRERLERAAAVANTIYLLFNEGYSASSDGAHVRAPLCEEAIRLARLLLRTLPSDPEPMGLLALCLLQHARFPARLDAEGEIVLLEQQDRGLWHREAIAEGQVLVEKALRLRRPGPFQIQAAIAAVHCGAATAEATDWPEIERLYLALEAVQPSPLVRLNRAVAVWKLRGAAPALELVDPLADSLAGYLAFHALRGSLLARLERREPALLALRRALDLARTGAERSHLAQQLDELESGALRP